MNLYCDLKKGVKMQKGILVAILVTTMVGCSADDKEVVVAEVNNQSITESEFDAYLKFKRLNATESKQRKVLLDQYLERESISRLIEKEGHLDQEMINAELNEFRKEMVISRYFEQFLKKKVGEDSVKNYYTTHASEFEKKKVRVAHILLRTDRNMGEIERKAKLTTAMEAYSRIKAGESFADVAMALSEDVVSAKKGGDLGWVQEGAIDPSFSKTVFSMAAGDLAEPFQTSFGFHVVRVEEGPLKVVRPFDTEKGDIRYRLRNQFKNAELERLRAKTVVKKNS